MTARRRDESQQDVPIAITALDDDFLEKNNITEITNLRTHVPSLSISSVGNSANTPQVGLRGLRPMETMTSMDPAVPMYFADVVMTPTFGTNLAMYDLEQVQVLKGPQGTLFGRNSTGGAMLLQPQGPGEEFGGYVNLKAGNYDMYGVEAAVDIPLGDRVQFRLAGYSRQRDGYQENVADNGLNGKDYWDKDAVGGRVTMNVQFTDSLENSLVVGYDENDIQARIPEAQAFNPYASIGQLTDLVHNGGYAALIEGTYGIPLPRVPDNRAVDAAFDRQAGRDWQDIEADVNAREKVENTVVSNTTTWDLANDVTLKNIFGYRKVDFTSGQDADGTAQPLYGSITATDSRVTLNPPARTVEAEQFSNELQLLGSSFDNRLEWLVGAYWYDMEADEVTPGGLVGANPDWPEGVTPGFMQLQATVQSLVENGLMTPEQAGGVLSPWFIGQNGLAQTSPAGEAHNESQALFAEATYSLTERWDVTLGLRQTWDERAVTVRNRLSDPSTGLFACQVEDRAGNPLPDSNCERSESEEFSSPTWRLVGKYSFSDNAMAYGSVSTGYRSGGFNLRGVDNVTLQPFDEETVTTYELGHKADWQLGSASFVRTNLAVYYSKFEDIQKTQDVAVGDTFGTTTVNAAEAEIKGVDFDVLFAPTRNLNLSLAYSYVDAEYKEWLRPVGTSGNFTDVSDRPFIWVPEHSATGSIEYTLPLSPEIGEVSLMASIYWQDEVFQDDTVSNDLSIYGPDPQELVAQGLSPQAAQQVADAAIAETAPAFLESETVDAYSVVNLRLDWRQVLGSSFDLGVFVNNVEDKTYGTGGLTVEDTLGVASRVYGPPRTWGASLNWSF